MLGDELMLGTDIVVERDFRKCCGKICVGRGGGLAVAEERGNYNEILKDV